MAKFSCSKCNFRFERQTAPKLCPYCGSENTVFEDQDASQILKDVDLILE